MFENYEKFVETPKGYAWLEKHAVVIKVPADAYFYLPYGWIPQPFYMVLKEDGKAAPEVGYGWTFPILSDELWKELPTEVQTAVKAYNVAHFEKQSATFWKERAETLQKIWA